MSLILIGGPSHHPGEQHRVGSPLQSLTADTRLQPVSSLPGLVLPCFLDVEDCLGKAKMSI